MTDWQEVIRLHRIAQVALKEEMAQLDLAIQDLAEVRAKLNKAYKIKKELKGVENV